MNPLSNIRVIILLAFVSIFVFSSPIASQPSTNFTTNADKPKVEEAARKQEIKKIEEKAEATKEILEEKKAVAEAAQKEAAEIAKEKEAIEQEVKAKEAAAAKQQAEALKREAAVSKDPEALKNAKEIAGEAKKLEKEAEVQKDKLKVTETKVERAEKKAGAYRGTIDALKKELDGLRKAKAGMRTLKEKILISLIIIIIGTALFFLLKLIFRGFEKLTSKKNVLREDEFTLRVKTIGKLLNWISGFAIFSIVIFQVLETFGISVGPLLAGAGILGLAFGFGGQYLIRDLISGLFILLEGHYRIGDVIKIGDNSGLVEDINLRITTLRDLEGRVIIVPNGEITTVVNYTKGYAQALLHIGVAYKENVDRVMDVIKEIGKEMRQDDYFGRLILGDLEMMGVDDFGDSQVTIKFRMKTFPIKQWEVMREMRRRIKNRFDELGIEIPFPHRTIYWGTGKDNQWMKDFTDKQK